MNCHPTLFVMMTKSHIWLIAVAAVIVGCQKDDSIPSFAVEDKSDDFIAVSEGRDTKTALQNDLSVIWQKDDEVSIYAGHTHSAMYVVKKKHAGGTSATLSLDEEASSIGSAINDNVAVYPSSIVNACAAYGGGYQLSVNIPAIQYYKAGSFGASAMPMVAVSSGTEDHYLQFKNLYGALKIKLKGDGYPVRRIIIRGNNNERLSGAATVNCSNSSLPSVSFSSAGGTSITLDCEDGVILNNASDTEFIIAIPPVSFTNGLTATIESTVGSTSKTISSSIVISRNSIKPFSSTTISGYFNITKLVDSEGNEYPPLGLCGNHYSFCLPDGTDLTELKTVFEGDATGVTVGGVSQTSGVTVNDFTADVTYSLSLGGESKSVTVSAYDFDLPALYVETPNQASITSKTVWKGGTKVLLWDSSDNSVTNLGISEIKGRGNSTWNRPKKPYALKLDSKASVLGMPADKRWNLLANYIDRTMIRNAVALNIGQQTGLAWTPKGKFVELILNGVHQGNYFLCEHIKSATNRVNITEMTRNDIAGDAVTGGYILEITNDDVQEFNTPVKCLPVNIKEPDEDVIQPEQIAYLNNYFGQFENILFNIQAGDYRDYIDIDSFIDWWLVFELTMNLEPNHPKSCYMYKDRLGKLYAGPLWDFDWGTFILSRASSFQIKGSLYYPELFHDYFFVTRLKEKWQEYKANGTFDSVGTFIDQTAESVRKSDIKNFAMWESNQTINGDEHDSFDTAIGKLKSAYLSKYSWLNSQITNMVVPPAPQPQEGKNGNTTQFGQEETVAW